MFNDRLRDTRKLKNLKLQQMADMLDISLRSYQRYEGGNRYPPYDTLIKIADILDVSTDYLLCRTDNPLINK